MIPRRPCPRPRTATASSGSGGERCQRSARPCLVRPVATRRCGRSPPRGCHRRHCFRSQREARPARVAPEKCHQRHARRRRCSQRRFAACRGCRRLSCLRVEEAPRHRPHAIKRIQGSLSGGTVDGSCCGEQPQVGVDLLGRRVRVAPELEAVATRPAVTFSEIRGHRARRANHLITNRLQSSREPHHQLDGGARSHESFAMSSQTGFGDRVALLTSGSFMGSPRAGGPGHVKGAKQLWSSCEAPDRRSGFPLHGLAHRLRSRRNDPE